MKRRSREQNYGSDAVEAPEFGPAPSPDRVLDVAVEYTFPASDPIAIEQAYERARRREEQR